MKYLMLFEEYTTYHDELLDKISKYGIESLTDKEKEALKNLDNPEDETEKVELQAQKILKEVNKNKKIYDKTKKIGFQLTKILDTESQRIYIGNIYFRGKKFEGYMSIDKETHSPHYDFISSDKMIFEPAEFDLHYEFDDMMEEVFYDDQINKEFEKL